MCDGHRGRPCPAGGSRHPWARAGRSVRIYEKSRTVGHRFAGDFQGLENRSASVDAIDRPGRLGVRADFAHKPVREVVFYDHRLRPTLVAAPEPPFYLVRRGPEEGTLDTSLLDQARNAGAEVSLGRDVTPSCSNVSRSWRISCREPMAMASGLVCQVLVLVMVEVSRSIPT